MLGERRSPDRLPRKTNLLSPALLPRREEREKMGGPGRVGAEWFRLLRLLRYLRLGGVVDWGHEDD